MKNAYKNLRALAAGLFLISSSAWAHHGSAISYEMADLWTTWATVTEFNYLNPHPTMRFDRTTSEGEVEHWVSELLTNPAMLARAGWTMRRTEESLEPGTRVKLYVATARAGGFSGIVMVLENEDGEEIAGARGKREAVDMDGVPGGLQPTFGKTLPGRPTQ